MSKGVRSNFYADIMSQNQEVTGSCHLVVVKLPNGETLRIMVDCGLFQEKEHYDDNQKLICNPENLDYVLVTHNHIDHTGRLPLLIKKGYAGDFYTTHITKNLMPLALYDTCRILADLSKRKNIPSLYASKDVAQTINKTRGYDFNQKVRLSHNAAVTFFENGHLIGAAMILLQLSYPGYEDINLLFTGDYNNKNMFFNVEELPLEVRKLPLTIIQEATYGYVNSTEMKAVFEENVAKAIAEKKTVIAPVFSLGRAQEILYVLKKMQQDGRLSTSIPIYFDGKLAFKYTGFYLSYAAELKLKLKEFLPDNLQTVDDAMRMSIIRDRGTKIIVTTSGMGSYGPAQTYIPAYLPQKNALIHFTGYTAEGTLGRLLQTTETGSTVEALGLILVKRADVQYTNEYSAHAKADEMIDFLKKFENIRMVLVNHGQADVKEEFAKRILSEVDTRNVGILGSGYLFRVNNYGLIKTMGTRFE